MKLALLDDPRMQEVDDLSFRGELLARRGDLAGARELYRRAAPIDEALAHETPITFPNWRIFFATNAAALWAAAGDLPRAIAVADEFLSDATPRCDEHPDLEQLAAEYRARLAQDSRRPDPGPTHRLTR